MTQTKQEKAMDKLRDEMAKAAGRPEIAAIGEHMTERLQREPAIAPQLLDGKKSLDGAFGAVREYARKNQKGGSCVVSDEKAFEIVAGYYGIGAQSPAHAQTPVCHTADELDLDALLEG